MPDGWNWTNSKSWFGRPALAIMAYNGVSINSSTPAVLFVDEGELTLPSPVDVCADVHEKYALPYPPVASTVLRANTLWSVPSSIDMQTTPTHAPSTIIKSTQKNSMKKLQLCFETLVLHSSHMIETNLTLTLWP